MMITAHKKNHAKGISGPTKLNIALHAIRRQHTVTEISRQFDCSRTTVYKQQDKALDAANKAFDKDEEDVLFYIPVTKSFIQQAVISLRLICESSDRKIMFYVQTMYNYHVSLGTVFKLLSSWLQYDVLQLAGHPPETRAELYDFIVAEMESLALKHPHRIDDIVTSLQIRREALLNVSIALNKECQALASQYHVSIETIWTICYSARYDIDSVKYHETSCALESLLGLQYEEIEDAVLHILETTHRCSSMIENFNSRLRPYLDERKFMSQKSLNLIQFYLNQKPFMRSKHERLVNKTPAEALTGKAHKPWLEMLGFTSWYKQAA